MCHIVSTMSEKTKEAGAPTLESTTRELNNIRYALDKSAIVAITDHAETIIHINDKFCEISKYPREEILGHNHRLINSGHHARQFFTDMWKTISSGNTWEGEIKNRAKDGTYYWVHTTIVPFLSVQGKPYQYVSIRYDITQRKAGEEQLRVYADQLEHSNQEIKQSAMQDRLASVGLLASSLAHEIGTPLGVIRGRAELLELQVKDHPGVKKNVDIIISQIDRVSKLIRSLLNLARGDQMKSSQQINLGEVVVEVINLMAHELHQHEIEIKNELNEDIPITVKALAEPLHQVVLNLLVNSVHAIESAMKDGRKSGHFIKISVEDLETQWSLLVEDTGCGISSENLGNLFKPFFTTKDIGVGTGLGLATSYRIVESWRGSISVKSTEGVGTVFQILIPKN
jgi:PAS domain S-box-containing protein